MKEFKVGDRIRITKPKNRKNGELAWVSPQMDYLDGATVDVSEIDIKGRLIITEMSEKGFPIKWTFEQSWCERMILTGGGEPAKKVFKDGDIISISRSKLQECIDNGEFVSCSSIEPLFVGYHKVLSASDVSILIDTKTTSGEEAHWGIPPSCCELAMGSSVEFNSDGSGTIGGSSYDSNGIFSGELDTQRSNNLSEQTAQSLLDSIQKINAPKMKIYIAGKITGIPFSGAKNNFDKAKYQIEQWGFEPVSPLDYEGDDKTWVGYMLLLLPILNTCDGIYLLDNWDDSDGARIEKKFAEKKGMFLIKEVI